MKKLALILALIIIPCSAFGLEMLNDSTLDGVTGQAGVNIAADDIQMFINIEKMAWIDCDGFDSFEGKGTCGGNGGAMVLNNFQIDVLNINAITQSVSGAGAGTLVGGRTTAALETNPRQQGANMGLASTTCGTIPLFFNYATNAALGCGLSSLAGVQTLGMDNYYGALSNSTFTPHFLTIDVTDRLPASTEGVQFWANHVWSSPSTNHANADGASTMGGVLIGIPTMEIYINDMTFTPLYDGDITNHATDALNDDSNTWTSTNGYSTQASFGTIAMHGITFTMLSGWIEISPK